MPLCTYMYVRRILTLFLFSYSNPPLLKHQGIRRSGVSSVKRRLRRQRQVMVHVPLGVRIRRIDLEHLSKRRCGARAVAPAVVVHGKVEVRAAQLDGGRGSRGHGSASVQVTRRCTRWGTARCHGAQTHTCGGLKVRLGDFRTLASPKSQSFHLPACCAPRHGTVRRYGRAATQQRCL